MDKKSTFKIVKKYINFLKEKKYIVHKAYIFGSYARGNYSEDSDIDLAIILKNLDNSFITQIDLMKLGRQIDTRIEPHPIDITDFDHSNPFADEILKTGIEIE